MTKRDFLNTVKDLSDDSLIELKDSRCFIMPHHTYPKEWNVNINDNIIQIEINK